MRAARAQKCWAALSFLTDGRNEAELHNNTKITANKLELLENASFTLKKFKMPKTRGQEVFPDLTFR